jgi:ABC-type nickel/cobalt efflux system permease component RcnA
LPLCLPLPLAAQGNPFLSTGEGAGQAQSAEEAQSAGQAQSAAGESRREGAARDGAVREDDARGGDSPGRLTAVLPNWLTRLQRELYGRISGSFDTVRSDGFASPAFLLLLLFAFLYGLLHALGPGHRKTVLFSYFLARGAPARTGVAAGLGMALLHGLSAVAVVLSIYYLLRGALLIGVQRAERVMELTTFGLIALFGLVLLVRTIVHLISSHRHSAEHTAEAEGSAPGPADNPQAQGARAEVGPASDARSGRGRGGGESDRGTLLMILFSGSLPCPGAAMILLFALSMEMLALGVAVIAAMSLGMGVTLSAVALLTLGGRRLLLPEQAAGGAKAAFLHHAAELAGYGLVAAIGMVMFLSLL